MHGVKLKAEEHIFGSDSDDRYQMCSFFSGGQPLSLEQFQTYLQTTL